VLEVAAATRAGARDRARRLDTVGGGLEHLDGVSAPETVTVGAFGDLDDHTLTGQGVPGEDDTRLGLGQAYDAVAAVRHRSDLGLEALTDAGLPACLAIANLTTTNLTTHLST
jgi:hypothetical protein